MDRLSAISAIAVFITAIAAFIDVREQRIPNRLTYPSCILGFCLQGMFWGWKGILSALLGGVMLGTIFLLLYIVHAMGAGDLKMATALGCMVGGSASLKLLFAIAVAGGILALVYMVRARRVVQTLRNTLAIVAFHSRHGLQEHPSVNLGNPDSVRMPYGLAFAAGTVFWTLSLSLGR